MKELLLYLSLVLAPILGVSQPVSYLYLDGSESITIPNTGNINTSDIPNRTVEFWFKADDFSGTERKVIYEEGGNVRGINFWMLGDKLYLGMYNNIQDGEAVRWYGTWFRSNSIQPDTWYHVAIVLEGGYSTPSPINPTGLKWYLNGALQDEAEGGTLHDHPGSIVLASTETGIFPKVSSTWLSGTNSEYIEATSSDLDVTGSSRFKGAIGLLRIWNTARTQAEIDNNKETIYNTTHLDTDTNPNSHKLVAFLNGDYFEYVNTGNTNDSTNGNSNGNDGSILSNYTWNGGTSVDWNIVSNWKEGVVPPSGIDVDVNIETTVNAPSIPTGLTFHRLTISSTSEVSLTDGYIITVNDELRNYGTINFNGVNHIGEDPFTQKVILHNMPSGIMNISAGSELSIQSSFENNGVIDWSSSHDVKLKSSFGNIKVTGSGASFKFGQGDNNTLSVQSAFYLGVDGNSDNPYFEFGGGNNNSLESQHGFYIYGANSKFVLKKADFISDGLNNQGVLEFKKGAKAVISVLYNTNIVTVYPDAHVDIKSTGDCIHHNDGIFTIKSDKDGTGSLVANGAILKGSNAEFIVERYLDPAKTWQLVSSPMEVETANTFYGHFLNWYDEDQGDFHAIKNPNYKLDDNTDPNLGSANGYVAKRDGNLTGSAPNPILFNLSKPNTGDVNLTLTPNTWMDATNTYANTHFNLVNGFNLVGNPYPSNLNWNKIYEANKISGTSDYKINASYYRYNDNAGGGAWVAYNHGSNNADSIINLGQGFGVILRNNDAPFDFVIPNSARTHNIGNGFGKKNSTSSLSMSFKLHATSNGLSDNIEFRVNEEATSNFDGKYDAYKFNPFGEAPTPYFVSSDDRRLSICQQPESESVDLGFNMATSGEVVFSLSNVKDFSEILLEDKETGEFTDLLKTTYSFNYTIDQSETGRFTLHFKQEALSEPELMDEIIIYSNENSIHLVSENELNNVEAVLYSLSGQVIFSKKYNSLVKEEITTNFKGVCILKLSSDKGESTTKIILN